MVVNATMLTYGRSRLAAQAINSMRQTNIPFSLSIFDDNGKLGTGGARNRVIELESEDRGEYLYLSDNDVYFLPNWLEVLLEAYKFARTFYNVIAIGAYNHPYHIPCKKIPFYCHGKFMSIGLVHALATQSWLWKWEDWDKFGPFKETAPGQVCQGDDVDMGNKIIAAGGKLAVLIPPMIVNCGITNSRGEHIPGYDEVMKEYCPKGVIRD